MNTDSGRQAEWSIRHADGPQTIYYKTQFLVDSQANVTSIPPEGDVAQPSFDGPEEAAALLGLTEQPSDQQTTSPLLVS